jgi:hypothetical protein
MRAWRDIIAFIHAPGTEQMDICGSEARSVCGRSLLRKFDNDSLFSMGLDAFRADLTRSWRRRI